MNSAAEARFRIQAPNSRPRAIKVIGLDPRGDAAVRALAARSWRNAAFFTAGRPNELIRLDGSTTRVDDEVAEADLVVMVASAEGQAHAAAEIGRVCSDRRINTTTLIVGASVLDSAADAALSRTLAQVRPWSLMLVLASDEHYVADMMAALRA